jgi:hypothetical protein
MTRRDAAVSLVAEYHVKSISLASLTHGSNRYFLANNKYSIAEGATWFAGLADGISRGVALQIVPEVHVEDVAVRTARNPDIVSVSVALSNGGNAPETVIVNCEFSSWNRNFSKYPDIRPLTVVGVA